MTTSNNVTITRIHPQLSAACNIQRPFLKRKCFKLSDCMDKVSNCSNEDDAPSPNPKQGIRLSSSKGERVWPIILSACSYGLVSLPIACKLRLLNETFPANTQLQIVTNHHHSQIVLQGLTDTENP